MVGQTISRYRVLEKLGEGGMGAVYKAEDTKLRRTVALKFLRGDEPEHRERFLREAQAAAGLSHPNICTVYEVDEENGFLAIELVEGLSLKDKIAAHPLPLEEALGIAVQISHGLEAAHEKGIVHRDIKPANILLTSKGQVKITDFGLATLSDRTRITKSGVALGTPAYMSPEQAQGNPTDRRTDIWSLGVVLYEMVSGRLPFHGESEAAVARAILDDDPEPLTGVRSRIPVDLDRVVEKALAKTPENRYQHVEDLIVDLRRIGQGTPARVAPRPWVRTVAPWACAAVALAVAITVVWRARERAAPAFEPSFTKLTDQPGQELFPSLSPDGNSLIYASAVSGNWDLFLQRVGGKNPVNLTPDSTSDDTQSAFSPDGDRIAFRSERQGGGVFVMGATGEAVRRVSDFGYHPTWSPDGREIAVSTLPFLNAENRSLTSRIWVIDVTTGGKRLLLDQDAIEPSWSPHGHRIVYAGSSPSDLWSVGVHESPPKPIRITEDAVIDWNPVWAPDGNYVYYSSDRGGSMNLWRVRLDETSGKVLGKPEAVTTPSSYSTHPRFCRDGRLAYVQRTFTRNLHRVTFDPRSEKVVGQPVPLTRGSMQADGPHFSPDGDSIVFGTIGKQENLWIIARDGAGLRQLTEGPYRDRAPRWSPDGKRIAFHSDRSGKFEIWTIHPDGSGLQQLTRIPRLTLYYSIWSPDGSRIAYRTQQGGAFLIEVPPSGTSTAPPISLPPPPVAANSFRVRSWSPDGRKLAGHQNVPDGRGRGIVTYDLGSRTFENIVPRGLSPEWLADSRRVIYITAGGEGAQERFESSSVYLLDTRTGRERMLFSVDPHYLRPVTVSPDNLRICFPLVMVEADIWSVRLE